VFPTRVFPNPKPGFFGYFLLPETRVFQLPNPGILENLELLLHSNISDSDNTEVADRRMERPSWHVWTFIYYHEARGAGFARWPSYVHCWSVYIFVQLTYLEGWW